MTKKQSLYNGLIFLTVFAIFSCALVVNKLVNSCFYLLLIVSLLQLFFQRGAGSDFWINCKKYWQLNLAMTSALLAVLARQLCHSEFTIRLYDLPARLALFALIFWLLRQLPADTIKKLKWGFIIGAIFYAIDLYLDTDGGAIRVGNINSFSIIFSSELALLMGVFAILSIGWRSGASWLTLILQIAAGAAGLFSVYLSQTRGAWTAIPFFIFIVVSTLMHDQPTRKKIVVYTVILLSLVAIFSTTNIVQERLLDGQHDLAEITAKNNLDTSIGIRLQLWKASWMMFQAHPLDGVGKENFSSELYAMHQQGLLTKGAAIQYHSHNELLYAMATMGVFGLIATLLIYLVPAGYFARNMFHRNAQIHSAAAMGLSLCVGYIIFGLVDVMFGWNMCNVFYCTSIAVLFAFIVNKNKEIENQRELVPHNA